MATTMNGTEKALLAVGIGATIVAVGGVVVGGIAIGKANQANRGVADLYGQVGQIQMQIGSMSAACTPMGGSFVPQMNGGSNGIV